MKNSGNFKRDFRMFQIVLGASWEKFPRVSERFTGVLGGLKEV